MFFYATLLKSRTILLSFFSEQINLLLIQLLTVRGFRRESKKEDKVVSTAGLSAAPVVEIQLVSGLCFRGRFRAKQLLFCR
jgi:hypothetical protein